MQDHPIRFNQGVHLDTIDDRSVRHVKHRESEAVVVLEALVYGVLPGGAQVVRALRVRGRGPLRIKRPVAARTQAGRRRPRWPRSNGPSTLLRKRLASFK